MVFVADSNSEEIAAILRSIVDVVGTELPFDTAAVD